MSRSRIFALAAGAALAAGSLLLAIPPAAADVPDAPADDLFLPFADDPGGPGAHHGRHPGGPPGPPGRRGLAPERIARYLQLTDAQKESIRGAVEAHRASLEPLAEERRSLHERLRTLMDQGSPDPTAVGRLVLELKEQRESFAASREALADRIATLLVGEQRVKWQHLRELRAAAEPRPFHGRPRGRS